jgi:predicted TIM-barrel fold metal-dependent hydrolase
MIIDFQHHYTPPQLLQGKKNEVSVGIDKNGNPMHLLIPLLGDIDAHVRMMDAAGIDAAVLSSMVGFDQPDLKTCRIINDDLKGVEEKHPGRFIGLAHVPALKTDEMKKELKRCKVDLGFPGVVIASEMQGLGLDAPELKAFWKACADLELYVFIHPLAKVIDWKQMYADDLGRMLGWQFSLMTAAVKVMNSGLLDKLPNLNIQFAHFAGGLGRYLGRVRGFQQRDKWGTSKVKGHNRQPEKPFDYYLEQRLFYDCAGWAGPDHAGPWGAEWVHFGMRELALPQIVFATDYPQAVRVDQEVVDYVNAVRALGPNERAMLEGLNVEKLIPNARERLAKRKNAKRK